MTREEAIEYWEQFNAEIDDLYDACSDADRDVLVKQREIVEYTISALRQQDVADKDVGKNEPLTNAQKIRSMTDEELVNLHYSGSAHCIASDPTVCDRHDFIGNLTPCEQCYLKWLQQPCGGGE